jgi:hypothetical protein
MISAGTIILFIILYLQNHLHPKTQSKDDRDVKK